MQTKLSIATSLVVETEDCIMINLDTEAKVVINVELDSEEPEYGRKFGY